MLSTSLRAAVNGSLLVVHRVLAFVSSSLPIFTHLAAALVCPCCWCCSSCLCRSLCATASLGVRECHSGGVGWPGRAMHVCSVGLRR